jgi:hypothetical protein
VTTFQKKLFHIATMTTCFKQGVCVSILVLDGYPLGVVGIDSSSSDSNEPNQNWVQVLELIELKLTRSRVKYGTKRELRGSVQLVCRIGT